MYGRLDLGVVFVVGLPLRVCNVGVLQAVDCGDSVLVPWVVFISMTTVAVVAAFIGVIAGVVRRAIGDDVSSVVSASVLVPIVRLMLLMFPMTGQDMFHKSC